MRPLPIRRLSTAANNPSVGSLFVSMLATVGVDVPSFGNANGALPNLG